MPRMTPYRTGCDCFNATSIDPPDHANCCENVSAYTKVTCNYVIQFECNHYAAYGSGELELIAIPCLLLKKDCVRGCTWTSRWFRADPYDITTDIPYLRDLDPVSTPPLQPAIHSPQTCAEKISGSLLGRSCCHWGPDDTSNPLWHVPPNDNLWLTSCYDNDSEDLPCLRKWTLTITSDTTAYVDLETRGGLTSHFNVANFDSLGDSTMTWESGDQIPGLPTCLCLSAILSGQDGGGNPCGICDDYPSVRENDEECDCCWDFTCTLRFVLSLCGELHELELVRAGDNGGLVRPCDLAALSGVTTPDFHCILYWTNYGLGDDACDGFDSLGFLVWCDGTPAGWHVYVYCHETGGDWVFQEDAIDSAECQCEGIYFTFSLKTTECVCCCPPVPCEDMPDTLTATLSGGILCGCGASPSPITLTRIGATNVWTGTGAFGTCGQDITLSFDCDAESLHVSFSDDCTAEFDATLVDGTCWDFVTPDLVECIDAAGPCFLSIVIS